MDDKIWNDIMSEADDNKDGVISFDEFRNMMEKLICNST